MKPDGQEETLLQLKIDVDRFKLHISRPKRFCK